MQEPSEDELVAMAAQLRKPEGEEGIRIGDFMNEGNLAMNLHTIAALNPRADETILEVGMGNGAFVKNILGIDDSIQYAGLDYSPLMVEEAIKHNRQSITDKRASFSCGNIADIPFDDHSFDSVFTVNTFYFWDVEHSKIIQELKRVLKPQGRFLLAIRPYHVMTSLPVTQFNFGLMKDEEVIELFETSGLKLSKRTDLIEPEFEAWGQKYRLESLFLEFIVEP